MTRLLREPLIHFLLIGAALFAAYRYLQPARSAAPSSQEIQLSVDDLSQLAVLFQSQWRRDPTPEEFSRLVEQKVQSEVLYREALALGLDKNDEIVKRRMAQKMQFLAEDVAAAREPTSEELQAWYATHTDKFAMPKRVSFRHLYFSPDRRGNQARADAATLLSQLAGQPQDVKLPESSTDPFMFQEYYRDRAPDYLGKEFGPQFALAVEKLPERSRARRDHISRFSGPCPSPGTIRGCLGRVSDREASSEGFVNERSLTVHEPPCDTRSRVVQEVLNCARLRQWYNVSAWPRHASDSPSSLRPWRVSLTVSSR